MNIRRSAVLGLSVLLISCGKPNDPIANQNETRDSPASGSQSAFAPEVFVDPNDRRQTITLISPKECELNVGQGETLLASYTKTDAEVRVVFTTFGTQQVAYYARLPGKLVAKRDNREYLSPKLLAEFDAKVQAAIAARQAADVARHNFIVTNAPKLLVGRWAEKVTGHLGMVYPLTRELQGDGTYFETDADGKKTGGNWKISGEKLFFSRPGFRGKTDTIEWTIRELSPEMYVLLQGPPGSRPQIVGSLLTAPDGRKSSRK